MTSYFHLSFTSFKIYDFRDLSIMYNLNNQDVTGEDRTTPSAIDGISTYVIVSKPGEEVGGSI